MLYIPKHAGELNLTHKHAKRREEEWERNRVKRDGWREQEGEATVFHTMTTNEIHNENNGSTCLFCDTDTTQDISEYNDDSKKKKHFQPIFCVSFTSISYSLDYYVSGNILII